MKGLYFLILNVSPTHYAPEREGWICSGVLKIFVLDVTQFLFDFTILFSQYFFHINNTKIEDLFHLNRQKLFFQAQFFCSIEKSSHYLSQITDFRGEPPHRFIGFSLEISFKPAQVLISLFIKWLLFLEFITHFP